MRLLINLTHPKYFMPVHGELRHLRAHAKLAMTCGISHENIFVVENGYVIEADKNGLRTTERVPGGYVFVDGSGVGDIGPAVIRDREILARDGFMMVVVTVDKKSGELIEEPEIISRGFVYLKDASDLMTTVKTSATAPANVRLAASSERWSGKTFRTANVAATTAKANVSVDGR